MRNKKGFTLIELLTVIGIIALLLSIALPAFNQVRIRAKEMKVSATVNAVSNGLEMFKNDFGYYPESDKRPSLNKFMTPTTQYDATFVDTGAHHLAEALFGLDMLGYQKKHQYFVSDGTITDMKGNVIPAGKPFDASGNITKRDMYIDTKNLTLGTLADVRVDTSHAYYESPAWTNPNFVILDSIATTVQQQRPFLYYRANTRGSVIGTIYDYRDNGPLTNIDGIDGEVGIAYTAYTPGSLKAFPNYIWDPKSSNGDLHQPIARPYNKDSFLIITAGRDGEYGTEDDICNFDQNSGK